MKPLPAPKPKQILIVARKSSTIINVKKTHKPSDNSGTPERKVDSVNILRRGRRVKRFEAPAASSPDGLTSCEVYKRRQSLIKTGNSLLSRRKPHWSQLLAYTGDDADCDNIPDTWITDGARNTPDFVETPSRCLMFSFDLNDELSRMTSLLTGPLPPYEEQLNSPLLGDPSVPTVYDCHPVQCNNEFTPVIHNVICDAIKMGHSDSTEVDATAGMDYASVNSKTPSNDVRYDDTPCITKRRIYHNGGVIVTRSKARLMQL